MSPLDQSLLQKAAADCGFDRTPEFGGGGLLLRSAAFPETLHVQVVAKNEYHLSSDWPVQDEAAGFDKGRAQALGIGRLYHVLQRFASLARTRPNRVAEAFAKATATMPRTTEAERLVIQRVGQTYFREALLDYWDSRCCVCGLDVPELLRASHIKPWAVCGTDEERLDVHNGLLLAPHLDALFDGGWMTVDDDGRVRFSNQLSESARARLGLKAPLAVCRLTLAHRAYLHIHRSTVFRA